MQHTEAGLEGRDATPRLGRDNNLIARRDGLCRHRRPRVRLIVTAPADETPKSDSAERSEVEPGRGAAAGRQIAPSGTSDATPPANLERGLLEAARSIRSSQVVSCVRSRLCPMRVQIVSFASGRFLIGPGLAAQRFTGKSNRELSRRRFGLASGARAGENRPSTNGYAIRCSTVQRNSVRPAMAEGTGGFSAVSGIDLQVPLFEVQPATLARCSCEATASFKKASLVPLATALSSEVLTLPPLPDASPGVAILDTSSKPWGPSGLRARRLAVQNAPQSSI